MKEISTLPVKTIGHIPQSVRPKLAEVLRLSSGMLPIMESGGLPACSC